MRSLSVAFILTLSGIHAFAQPIDEAEILRLRKQLKHEQAIEKLKAVDGKEVDPFLLSELSLEASLLGKLGSLEKRFALKPKAALAKLATLDLSAREELTLAELCYLLKLEASAEEAIVRAREKNPELKVRTDEILAGRKGEKIPRGGYFYYRGGFIPMEERDLKRALDGAVEKVYALNLKGVTLNFIPSSNESNYDKFHKIYGEEGHEFLMKASARIRKDLRAIYNEVRGWIPSYSSASMRKNIQQSLEEMDPVRKEALALIRRYEKPQQPEVDKYRKELEGLYAEYERLVDSNLARIRNLKPERGYELLMRVRACEEALAELDRYFEACSLPCLLPLEIRPHRGADVSARHLLPGREPSSLEDVLWLVLNYAAGRTLDVLDRSAELLLQEKELTFWEMWVARRMQIEAMERYNRQAATSLDKEEREFIEILNGYRKMMGLHPFEVEERCVVAARKHSQEMVDLNYFGHISPVKRNRTPTDRVKLEGYGGGVGENCLGSSGYVDARGAFEGWYHSPGHHRLLISGSEQVGVGAADNHRMWTMVAGGMDRSWMMLHKDLSPHMRARLNAVTARFSEEAKKPPPSGETQTRLTASLPAILAFVAKEGFGAVHAASGKRQVRAPSLLAFLIHAEVPAEWRPLQVAAVAAVIDLLDIGESMDVRRAALDLIRPLVSSIHAYDPAAIRGKRRPAVVEIRKEWEDEAQWRYCKIDPEEVREPETPLGRIGDGPSLNAPFKVLTKRERLRLAKLHGGGTHTERAVDLGLEWLSKVQSEDGAWRSRGFAARLPRSLDAKELGLGSQEWEIAMTGLSLLCFVYGGNTTMEGDYAECVQKGANFLMARIQDYGKLETTMSHYMYGHAMATQALCELYAYTADPHIGICAQLCVDYLVYAQDPRTGGWRYRAKEAGDTSVTGWVLLALHSAQKAQLDIAGVRDALRFLNSVTYPYYFEVGYLSNRDGGHARLNAAGSLSRLFITGEKLDVRLTFNANRFLLALPKAGGEDFYYWYYATLLMFQLGGDYWKKWNDALVPALLSGQVDDGTSPFFGSFDPRGPYTNEGGRIYQTTLGLLMLMTYYRYDRALKPKVIAATGNLQREIEPYIKALRESEDKIVLDVTERKMVDKFGSALSSTLIKELQKGDDKVELRKRLASMLSRCAKPYCEPFIFELLAAEKDGGVREYLMEALDGIASTKSIPTLVEYLEDGNRKVRGYCASALGRIGDPAAVKPLSDRLEKEKDGWCKARIEEALQRLAHRESLTVILDDAMKDDDEGRLRIQEKLQVFERTGLAIRLLAMKAEEPKLYERIKAALREHKEWAGVPVALIGLESAVLDTRAESMKVLRALTRKNFGFKPEAPKEDRERSLEKWLEWWEKQQK